MSTSTLPPYLHMPQPISSECARSGSALYDSMTTATKDDRRYECIPFRTYGRRDNDNGWIIYVSGWVMSSTFTIKKGITSLLSKTNWKTNPMYQERIKYVVAKNMSNVSVTITAEAESTPTSPSSESHMSGFFQSPTWSLSDNSDSPCTPTGLSRSAFEWLDGLNEDSPISERPVNPLSKVMGDNTSLHSNDNTNLSGSEDSDVSTSDNGTVTVKTNSDGFFSTALKISHDAFGGLDNVGSIKVTCVPQDKRIKAGHATIRLIERTGISIISDIDDTIKETGILQGPRNVLNNTFLKQHEAVKGTPELYQKLRLMGCCFHYVSNGFTRLIDLIMEFMKLYDFPIDSIHLREGLFSMAHLAREPGQAKREHVLNILHHFPERQFVLIGDSGELDLEVYADIAAEYPDRILKVLIRDVTTPHAASKPKGQNRASLTRFMRRSSAPPSCKDVDGDMCFEDTCTTSERSVPVLRSYKTYDTLMTTSVSSSTSSTKSTFSVRPTPSSSLPPSHGSASSTTSSSVSMSSSTASLSSSSNSVARLLKRLAQCRERFPHITLYQTTKELEKEILGAVQPSPCFP